MLCTVAANDSPFSSTRSASWSCTMPSRRITAMLRTLGGSRSAIEMTRGRARVMKPCWSHAAAASVA
jgi:hypothetical protein